MDFRVVLVSVPICVVLKIGIVILIIIIVSFGPISRVMSKA